MQYRRLIFLYWFSCNGIGLMPRYPICSTRESSLSVKFHLRDGRTDRRTPGIEFGASVTSGGNNFSGFYPLPLNFLNLFFKLKHCGLFPHRMDARNRHNGQRDKRTIERSNERTDGRTDEETRRVFSSVRPSLR